MEVYEDMAEVYDLIYGDQVDAEFYLREARNARGPVLEVGCGTGRILLRLVQAGIDAEGLDLSKKMLGVLKKKAEALKLDPKVMQADMRDFKIGKKFKLIIVPYRSFLHLASGADRKKALLNFKEHLADGGRLVMHCYNPSGEEFSMTGRFHRIALEKLRGPDGTRYLLDWYLDYDPKSRLARYKIIMSPEKGASRTFVMDIAYISLKEMERLFAECGYRYVRAYCGFDYGQIDENCREAVWIAEK